MKKKLVAIFVAFVLTISLAACGASEETTLTGMVGVQPECFVIL